MVLQIASHVAINDTHVASIAHELKTGGEFGEPDSSQHGDRTNGRASLPIAGVVV
jgi:hypothetical protein